MNLNIFSDLRKPGLVPGKSLSPSTKIDSVLEKNQIYNMSNRMRSLHMHKQAPPNWFTMCQQQNGKYNNVWQTYPN